MAIHDLVPDKETNIDESQLKQILRDMLPLMRGKENVITNSNVAKAIGIGTVGAKTHKSLETRIRKILKEFLKEGIPVISCRDGYYVEDDPNALMDFCNTQYLRAVGTLRSMKSAATILARQGWSCRGSAEGLEWVKTEQKQAEKEIADWFNKVNWVLIYQDK